VKGWWLRAAGAGKCWPSAPRAGTSERPLNCTVRGHFNLRVIKTLVLVAVACGLLLHLYTVLFKAEGPFNSFLLGLLLWSWLPYAAPLLFLLRWRSGYSALGAALLALTVDLLVFYTAFIRPRSSTASLALLFAPLWNLLLFVPFWALIGWLLSRVLRSATASSGYRSRERDGR